VHVRVDEDRRVEVDKRAFAGRIGDLPRAGLLVRGIAGEEKALQ
jgi:hypothetical protein